MRLRRSFSGALVAALLVLVAARDAAAQLGRVGGIVKDEGGQPLKGATVTAENSNIAQTFTATTDEKGRFQMIGLRAGQWQFIAQSPGFSPEGGGMQIRMGSPNPPVTFVLKKTGVANFGALGGITNREIQLGLDTADRAMAEGRFDEAIAGYREVMARSTALTVVNLQIAAAQRSKKDYVAALATYDELLETDPANAKAHVGIAETHLERGDATAAEAQLAKAAAADGAGREVLFRFADMKFEQKDTTTAAQWYEKASTADPYWGKPIYKLALCAMQTGDVSEAARLMARVIAVDPGSQEAALAKTSLESLKK